MNNKHKLASLFIIATSLLFTSCEKVIDVDLNSASPKIVIEAVVSDEPGKTQVLISSTKNFNEDNTFAGIAGATVTVKTNGGTATMFTPTTTAGVYESTGFVGVSGNKYDLSVVVNGQTFTATSTMPAKINIDTVYTTDEDLFGEVRKLVNYEYQDLPGKGNSVRFVQYVNGYKEKTIFGHDDDYTDGKYVKAKLWYFADDDADSTKIKTGDVVDIEAYFIPKEIYKYWYSLATASTGQGQSATPANPVTNISGGALGYFSAQTYQRLSFIAK